MEILIIDAYNVINHWPKTAEIAKEDMANARDILNEAVLNYASYKGIHTIVVYDAYQTETVKPIVEENARMQIVYTKKNQTADAYIEALVHRYAKREDVCVVTSDWTLQKMVLSGGLIRKPVSELILEMTAAEQKMRLDYEKDNHKKQAGEKEHKNQLLRLQLEKIDKNKRG
jgi:hypothetical protein